MPEESTEKLFNKQSLSPIVTTPAPILVATIGEHFWLRIEGKGSFQNSVQLKKCLQGMIDKGVQTFVVDLDRCPIMDSTFMGTLTGAALNLKERGDGEVVILNANARNQQLLSSLGLDHILTVDNVGVRFKAERAQVSRQFGTCEEPVAPSKTEQAEHVLEAHEALTEANAENASRFRDVIEFLEKELGAKDAS